MSLLWICKLPEPPWGYDNKTPNQQICHCCGVTFGYEDLSIESVIKFREEWLKNGAKWPMEKEKPIDWDLKKQLKNLEKLIHPNYSYFN